MWAFPSKLWRALSSRTVAIVLLSAVTLMVLVGGLLPDPRFMGDAERAKLRSGRPMVYFLSERLNPGTLARGYFFGITSVFLIISTTACSIDRSIERRRMKRAPLARVPAGQFDISAEVGADFIVRLTAALRLQRWAIREEAEGGRAMALAEKGAVGYWGSVLFHAVLITALIGMAVHYLTGFYGSLSFTEGQSRLVSEEALDRVDKRPVLGIDLPRLRFTLEHFLVVLWEDREPVEYSARFLVEDIEKGGARKQEVKVNEPFSHGGVNFLLTYYGFSPNFVLYRDGAAVFDSYVTFKAAGSEDSFDIPGEGVKVRAVLFPDFRESSEGFYSETELPRNPVVLAKVTKGGKNLYTGLIPLGREVKAGEYVLRFNDVKYWIALQLSKETGLGFFFWASMAGLLGLLLRFVDPDRKIFLRYEGGVLSVLSYSRHFEGILKQQTAELVNNLIAGGGGQ